MAGESEIKLGIKAFADIDAAVKAYSELERKNESLEAKLKNSSKEAQKSKSQEIDMIKRWQQANNEAMAAQVANAKKFEKLAQERQQRLDPNRIDAAVKLSQVRKSEMAAAERREALHAASRKTQIEQQQAEQRRIEWVRRAQAMADEHATGFASNWSRGNRNQITRQQEDAVERRRIDAAIKLSQIRKSEMAAAERRGTDIQQLKESGDAMDSLAGKVLGLGLAYGTLKLTIGAALTEQKAFLDGYDRIAKVGAIAETELRIQGGLTKTEVTKSMPAMERALADIPAIAGETPEAMYQGALKLNTQLASSGFSKADIESGKAFSATLKMKAASNRFGVGAGGEAADVQSLVTFLKGAGNLSPTAADVERVGGAISQLFRDSDLQFSNLEFLAPKASGLSAVGMNENLQLAAFATLRDVAGAEKAATGLDIITNRTATAATSKERVKALGELGLTPSDVAITKHGKQWLPTMLKLRERFAGLSEEQRGNLQTELFGEEGQRVAATLFAPGFLEKIREREQTATLQPDFLKSVDEFRNSRLARMRRPDVALAFSRRRTDAAAGEFTWSERDQQDAAIRQLRDERAPWYERFANNLQDMPGRAAHWGMSWFVGAGESGTPNLANRLTELQQQQLENQERQIQVLERIEINSGRERNRNGNVETVRAN